MSLLLNKLCFFNVFIYSNIECIYIYMYIYIYIYIIERVKVVNKEQMKIDYAESNKLTH